MRDVRIWDALHDEDVEIGELTELLDELARAPLAARAVFLGAVVDVLARHRSPRVRAAAVRALGGCLGVEGARAVAAALDDNHADVRAAAVEALALCSMNDGAPFICALFHRRIDVRRLALGRVPMRVQAPHIVLLLADGPLAGDVRALLDRRERDGWVLPGLLAARRHGLMALPEVVRRLAAVPLADKAQEVLGPIAWPGVNDAQVATIDALRGYLTTLVATDPLSEALELLWRKQDGVGPLVDDAPIVAALVAARRTGKLRDVEHRRLAVATAQIVLTHGESTPRMLALAALSVPAALFAEPDVARRRAAVRALVDVAGREVVGKAVTLKSVADGGLLTDDTGALDATLVAGAMRLVFDAPYQRVREVVSTEKVAAAFWRAPLDSTALLALPPRSPPDREAFRAIVRDVLAAMSPGDPGVVAALAMTLPGEGAFALDDIERQHAGLAERSIGVLLDDRRVSFDDVSAHHLARNAAVLAAQIPAHAAGRVLARAGNVGAALRDTAPVAALTADAVFRALPRAHLEAAVRGLDEGDVDGVVERLSNTVLPIEAERVWAGLLRASPHAAARRWAAPRIGGGEAARAIAEGLTARLTHASDVELPLVAAVFLREPLTGLVDALEARAEIPHSARLCAALLASHDPPHRVAALFQQIVVEEPPFLSAIDHGLLDDDTRRDLPLLATAWVHADAAHAVRFEHTCRTLPGGLRAVVDLALAVPAPLVSWKVMRALVEVVRGWAFQRRQLLEKLDAKVAEIVFALLTRTAQPRPPTGASSTFNGARAVRRLAGELLVIAHSSGSAVAFVDDVKSRLTDLKPELEPDLRTLLAPVATWPAPPAALGTNPADQLWSTDAHVVRAAVDALNTGGRDGQGAIVAALTKQPAPACLKLIIERAIFDEGAGRALLADDVDAEVRFRAALRLDDHKAAVDAACAPLTRPWLVAEDVAELSLRLPGRALALKLAGSPHALAQSKVVWTLLSLFHDDPTADVRAALHAFLESGDGAEASLRAEVAAALLLSGERAGESGLAPLLVACALAPPTPRHELVLRDAVGTDLWLAVIRAAAIAGDGTFDSALQEQMEKRTVDDEVCAAIALYLLKRGVDEEDARPLFAVLRRARFWDEPRVDALRSAVQWGVRQARVLMGRPVSVEFIHDALGYTRLHQPRIYINPLPLLRGERGGDDVVRGLMVHEIGHHLYHADDLGKRCWAEAQKEGIAGLLNLVADEHLERNLRAIDDDYGDHLKVLASYAFQHSARDIWLEDLMRTLGQNAARVLTRVTILPGKRWGSVNVELGKLLAEISSHTSFARFMRALRQGLGGRDGDPKVKEALALFDNKSQGATSGGFRAQKMDRLLEIARAIKRIFGDETKLLETFGLHETMEAGEDEMNQDGFSPDELQRELDRKKGTRTSKIEKPRWNDAPDERFDVIDQIVPLTHDPVSHRHIVDQGRRATKAMRSVFDELGTRIVVERRRLSGRSLDRQGLTSAILRMDPRLLVRRTPTPAADLFVGVVVDCSGSMAAEHSMDKARVFATSLAEAARGRPGVEVRIFGFTDTLIYDAGDAERCAAHALSAGGGNNDSAGLWHAAVAARRSKKKHKLLVMVSDGLPTECSAASLKSLASKLERGGMLTAQVAVRPLAERCFKHYVEILDDDVDDAARRFARVIGKLVRKTVGTR